MHRKLIEEAFKKAEEDLIDEGHASPSVEKKATHLSQVLEVDSNYGPKTFHKLYNKTLNAKDKTEIKRLDVVLGICKYLGYPDYESCKKIFDVDPDENEQSEEITSSHSRSKKLILTVSISIAFALIIGICYQIFMPKQQWMEWKSDHYTEVKFDSKKLNSGTLKLYKEERILYFKKIKPDCNTEFFTDKGIENLWYGKNEKGKLEFFTDQGLHPETGKTLKAITPYMIRKYICEDY
ncbi:hypothetical protein [Sinomicrobium sp. M5D2P9]